MAADNWDYCPRCNLKHIESKKELEEQVNTSYGLIPIEEWLELKKKLDSPLILDLTLREDYEIGGTCNQFYVKYKALCMNCGWEHIYNHREDLTLNG